MLLRSLGTPRRSSLSTAAVGSRSTHETTTSREYVADILWIVAKYDPLFEYLCRAADAPVVLTFDEVERLVGPLPASATKFKQWWHNESTGGRDVHAKAWLNAGRQVERVDLSERCVRFSAAAWRRGS